MDFVPHKLPGKKFKLFVTRHMPQGGIDILKPVAEILSYDKEDAIPRCEFIKSVKSFQPQAIFCLLTDTVDDELLRAAGPHLRIVATMSVGYEHIDLDACKKRNIVVTHTPFVSTESVAELTLTLLLAVARRVREANKAVMQGEWGPWKPLWLCGATLEESTVGIFGLGRIGFAIAERVVPFKIGKLLYHDVAESPNACKVGAKFVNLDTLLRESDFVISMCPLTPETKHIFNRCTFGKMKKTAIFINTSRGGVVNEKDLYDALKAGTIAGAGLDVTDPEPMATCSPLLTLPNCMVLPHVGSSTLVAREKMSLMTAENILTVMSGGSAKNEVK